MESRDPVVSCSRRTDIPAWHMNWLMDNIKRRCVRLVYRGFTRTVSLEPADVHCWVWWSKDYSRWLDEYNKGDSLLRRYRGNYFHFTITGCNELESLTTTLLERMEQFSTLCNLFSPASVMWRFDPIVYYGDRDNRDWYIRWFETIADFVSGCRATSCIVSFMTHYQHVLNRLSTAGYKVYDPPIGEKVALLEQLAGIAADLGIRVFTCASVTEFAKIENVYRGVCIDGRKLRSMYGGAISIDKDVKQRELCGCSRSTDIGTYDMRCGHNCLYCYSQGG